MFTEALQTGEPDQAAENVPQLSGRWRSTECEMMWKLMAFGKRKKAFLHTCAAAEEVQSPGTHRVRERLRDFALVIVNPPLQHAKQTKYSTHAPPPRKL